MLLTSFKNKMKAIIKQLRNLKRRYPDAILIFRTESDYQCYNEDAEITTQVLGITLIKRAKKSLLSFPHSMLDKYLPKLVRAGHRVAICEPLSKSLI